VAEANTSTEVRKIYFKIFQQSGAKLKFLLDQSLNPLPLGLFSEDMQSLLHVIAPILA